MVQLKHGLCIKRESHSFTCQPHTNHSLSVLCNDAVIVHTDTPAEVIGVGSGLCLGL